MRARVVAGDRRPKNLPTLAADASSPGAASGTARVGSGASAPDLPHVPRERLFDLLDASVSRPLVWISAPPGSGKTTLATGYLAARRRAHLRVVLDAHDAEPAGFFHTLRTRLVRESHALARTLPVCLPDDVRGDPVACARQFFRRVFETIRPPWTLVLDDFQKIGESTPLHAALADSVEELPAGAQLWMLSRSEPAAPFARARAGGRLDSIGAAELRFSLAESRALCVGSDTDAERLHALVDGWAAGLVLVLEHERLARRAARPRASPGAVPERWLFDYFAAEVFDRLAGSERRLLLRVAALPWASGPMADALAHPSPGAAVLEALCTRNLFVERRPDPEPPRYVLHELFRAFLERRARDRLPGAEWRGSRRRAAQLLLEHGEHDLAFDALIGLGERGAAAELVLRAAPKRLDTGRLDSVARWTDALGPEIDARPMLRYWRAACRLHDDPGGAAEDFATAAHELRDLDALGELLAIAGCCEATVVAGQDLGSLDRWIARFESHARDILANVDAATELRTLPGLLAALVARQPQHPLIDPLVERAETILERDPGARQRILLATVAGCYIDHGQHERMGRLVERIESTADPRAIPPSLRLRWLHASLFWKTLTGRLDGALEDAAAARALCEEHGLRSLRPMTAIACAQARWAAGRVAEARDDLRRARTLVAAGNLVARSVVEFLEGVVALQQGQPDAAVTALRQAVALAAAAGSPGRERMARCELALALTESGALCAAEAELADARRHPSFARSPFHRWVIAMIEANLAERSGDAARAEAALRLGAHVARLHGYRYAPELFATGLMPRLCARALALDIDAPLVGEWIRSGGLRPPDADCERWPWPLRLRLFGGLVVERDGTALPRGRKSARRPLDLLAHLVAHGGEAGVGRLCAELWPEASPRQARASFDNTVHRLRRLLGVDGAIVARGTGIAIDQRVVAVDALALDRLLARAHRALGPAGDPATLEALATELLGLGEAPFVAGDDRSATLVLARTRLARARSRSLLRIAERLAGASRTDAAIELLERVVEQDPVAEGACRRLLRLYAERGAHDEALAVYRQLREALARERHAMPARETVRAAAAAGALGR